LSTLEKQTEALNNARKVQAPRLEELQAVSDAFNSDPYTLSLKARRRFRTGKKVDMIHTAQDNALKDRYSLPSDLALVREDESSLADALVEWRKAKAASASAESSRRRKLLDRPTALPTARVTSAAGGKYSSAGLSALGQRILENTASRRTASTK
jgi:coiled-coil domain-containing protein 130